MHYCELKQTLNSLLKLIYRAIRQNNVQTMYKITKHMISEFMRIMNHMFVIGVFVYNIM